MIHIPNTIFTKPKRELYLWSGADPLPDIGDRLNIKLNGWEGCKGTVVGYRVDDCGEGGKWIGVCVHVDKRPDWHMHEMPTRNVAFFVGCEVEIIK